MEWLSVAALSFSQQPPQIVNEDGKAVCGQPPLGLLIDDVPGRQIIGHHAPGGAGSHNPAQAVEDFAEAVGALSGVFGQQDQVRHDKGPFFVTDIAWIRGSWRYHPPFYHFFDLELLTDSSEDQTVRLWEVSTGRCLHTLFGHGSWIRSVAFSSDGAMLVSGSEDQTVRLWDVSTGQCLKTLHAYTNWVYSVAFNPDGTMLASGNEDKTVRLWETKTGQCVTILQGHTKRVRSVAFSPNGNMLASGSDNQTVRLWDVSTGQCITTLYGHTNRVWSVSFSSDSRLLVSGSDDKTVRFWDVNTGQCFLQGNRI